MHLSWLDPHKVRRLTLVGARRMAVFDDMEPAEKIRLHDKGPVPREPGSFAESLAVRFGETRIPRIPASEPLRDELRAFLRAAARGEPVAVAGGADEGVKVVQVLAAADRSLRAGGARSASDAVRDGRRDERVVAEGPVGLGSG